MSDTDDLTTSGIVYILTNECMPGYIKIGRTNNLQRRLKELDQTALPLPFDVFHASRVDCMHRAERLLHRAFADRRVRKNREFFSLDPANARAALQLAEVEDMTDCAMEQILENLDNEEDRASLLKSRQPNWKIIDVGILPGTVLSFKRDPSIKAVVTGDNQIELNGKEGSLSSLALELLNTRFGKNWRSCNGWPEWEIDGTTLSDLSKVHAAQSAS